MNMQWCWCRGLCWYWCCCWDVSCLERVLCDVRRYCLLGCVTCREIALREEQFYDFRTGFMTLGEVLLFDQRLRDLMRGFVMSALVAWLCKSWGDVPWCEERLLIFGEVAWLQVRLRDPITEGFEIWTPNIDSVKAGDTWVCRACGNFIGISFATLWLFVGFVSDSQSSFGESKKYL